MDKPDAFAALAAATEGLPESFLHDPPPELASCCADVASQLLDQPVAALRSDDDQQVKAALERHGVEFEEEYRRLLEANAAGAFESSGGKKSRDYVGANEANGWWNSISWNCSRLNATTDAFESFRKGNYAGAAFSGSATALFSGYYS